MCDWLRFLFLFFRKIHVIFCPNRFRLSLQTSPLFQQLTGEGRFFETLIFSSSLPWKMKLACLKPTCMKKLVSHSLPKEKMNLERNKMLVEDHPLQRELQNLDGPAKNHVHCLHLLQFSTAWGWAQVGQSSLFAFPILPRSLSAATLKEAEDFCEITHSLALEPLPFGDPRGRILWFFFSLYNLHCYSA